MTLGQNQRAERGPSHGWRAAGRGTLGRSGNSERAGEPQPSEEGGRRRRGSGDVTGSRPLRVPEEATERTLPFSWNEISHWEPEAGKVEQVTWAAVRRVVCVEAGDSQEGHREQPRVSRPGCGG